MIIDQIKNWRSYCYGTAWEKAFDFLTSLQHDAEDKKYFIQGEDIFAQIVTYRTMTAEMAFLETHQKYVDIQTVLKGGEKIECFNKDKLVIDKPYDEEIDAEFYIRQCHGPIRLDLTPDKFAVFFPQDAHMPSLMLWDAAERVKKVVVKIKADLLLAK